MNVQNFVPICDPNNIAHELSEGRNTYWCGDKVDNDLLKGFQNLFQNLLEWRHTNCNPITFDEWQLSLKCEKRRSMRGADSFLVKELRRPPQSMFDLSNLIFFHAEERETWPSLLTRTWVILCPSAKDTSLGKTSGQVRCH